MCTTCAQISRRGQPVRIASPERRRLPLAAGLFGDRDALLDTRGDMRRAGGADIRSGDRA